MTRYPRQERHPPSSYSPGSALIPSAFAAVEERLQETYTVDEALLQSDAEDWKTALDYELKYLRQHGTSQVVDPPEGCSLYPQVL